MPLYAFGGNRSGQGLNVKTAFGAVGGSGTTDDSAAFLAAINATTGTGVPIYVPPGRYAVALSLTDQDVNLYGEGTLVHRRGASIMNVRRTPGPAMAVTGFGRVLLGVRSGVVATDSATFTQTIAVASVAGFQQGQLHMLSSQDAYGWSTVAAGFSGATIWQTQYVRILGIGVPYAGGTPGQLQEGQTVAGAASGATALVKSVSDGGATSMLVFSKVAGAFAVGETLLVNGAAAGQVSAAPCLLTPVVLRDAYPTNPVLQRVDTSAAFSLDGLSVDADGDTDAIVGAAARLPAFVLAGVYRPRIHRVTIKDAWTRCIQLLSCWQGEADVYIERLPNNANASEAAYGYGVELAGSTEGTRVSVQGGNCRHAVTTNVFWGGFAFMDLWSRGTARGCHIHDSVISGNFNAAFDTHAGCVDFSFANCLSRGNSHANRNVSANIGFQNRGFATSYVGCKSVDAVVGFNDLSPQFDAGWANVTRYDGCHAVDYQSVGFMVAVAEANNTGWIEFTNCRARGNGDAPGGGHYTQAGFWVNGYNNVRLQDCHSERFNSTPFWFGGGGYMRLAGLVADYSQNPGFSLGMRFDGVPVELSVWDYRVRADPNHGAPFGLVYNAQASPLVLQAGGDICCINLATVPLIDTRSTGAGPVQVTWMGMGRAMQVSADYGDANATLAPRASPRINRWATPLTANRAVSLASGTTTGTSDGDWLEIWRDAAATGSFTLTVACSPIVALAAGQMTTVVYDAGANLWRKKPAAV